MLAGGRVVTRFKNGDVKEECVDGSSTYFYRCLFIYYVGFFLMQNFQMAMSKKSVLMEVLQTYTGLFSYITSIFCLHIRDFQMDMSKRGVLMEVLQTFTGLFSYITSVFFFI